MARLARTWAAWWIFLAAFYVLLIGQIKGVEVGAGLLCGGLAAIAYTVTKAKGKLDYFFPVSWLAHLAPLPGEVLKDTGAAFGALWRVLVLRQPVGSRFVAIPFDYGGEDAASAMRRAFVTAVISFTPNAIVVAVDEEEGSLLLHQLVPTPEPPGKGNLEWPI